MIECDHWSQCGVGQGGCCAAGHYGGRPSLGVCKQCPHRVVGAVPQEPIKKVVHFAKGAAKAVQAVTLPETPESQARLEVCKGCDQWTGKSCKVCGCFVNLKVRIPEEKCPLGKW